MSKIKNYLKFVNEEEGNAFTKKLHDTEKGSKFKLGGNEYTDKSDYMGMDDMGIEDDIDETDIVDMDDDINGDMNGEVSTFNQFNTDTVDTNSGRDSRTGLRSNMTSQELDKEKDSTDLEDLDTASDLRAKNAPEASIDSPVGMNYSPQIKGFESYIDGCDMEDYMGEEDMDMYMDEDEDYMEDEDYLDDTDTDYDYMSDDSEEEYYESKKADKYLSKDGHTNGSKTVDKNPKHKVIKKETDDQVSNVKTFGDFKDTLKAQPLSTDGHKKVTKKVDPNVKSKVIKKDAKDVKVGRRK